MDVQQLLQTLRESFAKGASVKTVYGQPVTAGVRTAIQVAEVRYGFGAGGNKKDETARGGFIAFDEKRKLTAAWITGFAPCALMVALTRRRRIRL